MSILKFKTFSEDQADLLHELFGFTKTKIKDKFYITDDVGEALSIFPRQIDSYPYPNDTQDLSGGFDGRYLKRAIEILEELLKDRLQAVYTGPTATPMIFLGRKFEVHLAPKKGKELEKDVIELMRPKRPEEEA
jgi:hypothetical protein